MARDHPCDILANVGALCPCPKNLLGTTFKSFGLMTMVEETKDSLVLTVTWLLEITLMQVYNEKSNRDKRCK